MQSTRKKVAVLVQTTWVMWLWRVKFSVLKKCIHVQHILSSEAEVLLVAATLNHFLYVQTAGTITQLHVSISFPCNLLSGMVNRPCEKSPSKQKHENKSIEQFCISWITYCYSQRHPAIKTWGSLHMMLSSISSMIRVKSSKLACQSSIFGLQS